MRSGQRGGGQGVRNLVRRKGWRIALDVGKGAELGRGGMQLGHERAVGENVVNNSEHSWRRDTEGETRCETAILNVGLAHEVLGQRVLDVVDAGHLGALVNLALGARVGVQRAVPVDVVGRNVEHRAGPRCHRSSAVSGRAAQPMQLKARQLDREDVVRLGMLHHLDQWGSDVAGCLGPQPRSAQHRGEHAHGGGLTVGAGQGEPRRGTGLRSQPPSQLDLAPHRDCGRGSRGEQGLVRSPTRRGDDQVGPVASTPGQRSQPVHVFGTESDVGAEDGEDLASFGGGGACLGIDHHNPRTAFEQCVSGRKTAAPQACHDDGEPGPVGRAMGQRVEPHEPTTHSA